MTGGGHFTADTWIGDTGASTHMGNSDAGMFDVKEINDPVRIGNGKVMRALKIGKLRRTVRQNDGQTFDIVLQDYKYVPGLMTNLFSITKSLQSGWNLSNEGVKVILKKKKGDYRIVFDKTYKSSNGVLCGIDLLVRMVK